MSRNNDIKRWGNEDDARALTEHRRRSRQQRGLLLMAATIKGCAVDCDACANRPMTNPDNGAVLVPMPPSLLRQHWADIEMLRAWHSAPWWRRAWAALCRFFDRMALAAFGEVRL